MRDEGTDSPGRATIDDVATRAGVSVATVSRALRGFPNVAVSTRRRIEQAADDLRYRPDPAAARLAAGRTNTVTIAIPHLNSWYFSNVVAGAEAICAAAGYELQVVGLGSAADLERLVDPGARLERRTDALILVDIDVSPDTASDLRHRDVTVGTIGFRVEGCPAVQLDDELVGRLAGEHLVEVGCRRPAIIIGLPDDPMRWRVPDLRRDGFDEAVRAAHGLPGRVATASDFGIDGGRFAMAQLLDDDRGDRPDGVFAMSDEMAFGALMELRSRHVPVGAGPGRVAVVGVDDHEFSPVVELTTVRQEVGEHGAWLARRVIDTMVDDRRGTAPSTPAADAPAPGDDVMRPPVHLVRRASTANALN